MLGHMKCRCDPTRGQTCRPCADGVDALEDLREGYEPADDWQLGQTGYESQLWAQLGG